MTEPGRSPLLIAANRGPLTVVATEDGQLEVTVFPVDGNHASEIERVVRDALT